MISDFFIRRPIVAMVIAIVTVLGGLIAMRGLPLAQFPEIVPPQIIVSTTYTGADAITIEQSVSTPLEQQMNGVDNMLYMQSTNANDGTEQLTVTFDVDTDVNIDQVNVQNRVAQAQPNLPTDVNQFGLTTRKSTGLPMLVISLYLAQQDLRFALPRQLRQHQHQRRPLSRAGRGRGEAVRRQRLRDAHLGQAGRAGQTRSRRFPISPTRSGSRAPSTPRARSAPSLRRRAWRRPTPSARRGGSRRRRSSARSSSAPTRTARSCA